MIRHAAGGRPWRGPSHNLKVVDSNPIPQPHLSYDLVAGRSAAPLGGHGLQPDQPAPSLIGGWTFGNTSIFSINDRNAE